MKIAGICKESVIDGPGINYVIYFQGCIHECLYCHNPETWDVDGGIEIDMDKLKADILATPLVSGVTFSGGEPLLQIAEVRRLAEWAHREKLKTNLYTGYELIFDEKHYAFIAPGIALAAELFDTVIDGPYKHELRDLALEFRGSSNQRIMKRGVDY